MTDDQIDRTLVQPAAESAKDSSSHRLMYLGGLLILVGVVALGILYFVQRNEISDLHTEAEANRAATSQLSADAHQLAEQVKGLGGTPVVQPPPPPPSDGGHATGPSQAQIDGAVAAQLAAHPPAPGKNATPEMVASVVADYLTAHPPEPGRPPTAQEIATATSTYIANHADDFRGANATDAQVAAAVASYCDSHGSCAGKDGTNGHDGTPAQTMRFTTGTDTYDCTRSGGTDTSPIYACVSATPPAQTVTPPAPTN